MKYTTIPERLTDLHLKNEIGMYYCGKRIETPDHTYGPEIRNHYLFVLVNKGTAMMYHPKEISFGEHDLLVMLPNERIHYKALEPWSISWVGLYGETIKEYMDLLGVTPQNPILHISLYNELKTILDETLREGTETLPYAKFSNRDVSICKSWRFMLVIIRRFLEAISFFGIKAHFLSVR